MPTTVRSLFSAAGIAPTGVVSWGTRIPPADAGRPGTGVYVVALTDELDSAEAAMGSCPISLDAVRALLEIRPELTLDGKQAEPDALAERLTAFWCPDEVVVYIGRAGIRKHVTVSHLSDRVDEYYDTPLGARSPHAGGWPIKTLANLKELFVHFAYCDDVSQREVTMLDAFAEGISEDSSSMLYDPVHIMPFANLTAGKGRKAHGIKGARAHRSK